MEAKNFTVQVYSVRSGHGRIRICQHRNCTNHKVIRLHAFFVCVWRIIKMIDSVIIFFIGIIDVTSLEQPNDLAIIIVHFEKWFRKKKEISKCPTKSKPFIETSSQMRFYRPNPDC